MHKLLLRGWNTTAQWYSNSQQTWILTLCLRLQHSWPEHTGGLSLFGGVTALTLGMETLAWRPLIFTLSGLTDRSVWPWEMLWEAGVVPSVLDSFCSCLPVWLCANSYSKQRNISHKLSCSKHLEQKGLLHTARKEWIWIFFIATRSFAAKWLFSYILMSKKTLCVCIFALTDSVTVDLLIW